MVKVKPIWMYFIRDEIGNLISLIILFGKQHCIFVTIVLSLIYKTSQNETFNQKISLVQRQADSFHTN